MPAQEAPLKIALVLSASTGGIGRHVASVADRLVGRGHGVRIFCPPATAAAHQFGRMEVQPLDRLHRARGADVLHAHGYKAGAVALVYARIWRIPLVVTWHNAVLDVGWRGSIGRSLQRLVARGADLTLGASDDLVVTARFCGAPRAELAPVAAPRLPPPTVPRPDYRARLGLGEDDILVVTVGRLAPQKNLGMVLDIAAVSKDQPRLHFVIAGDGPLGAGLAARVRRDGSQVQLVGRCNDVASLLGAADVALLTSSWEARALFAQEAMLAGVPLFSTRVGGIEELVGDAAVLFDLGQVREAACALGEAVGRPRRLAELAAAGRAQAASWPDEDRVVADLAATYARLVSEGAAGHSTKGPHPT